ncbi:MAG TPA: ABC transporter substrate-binding protein [Solirubrobacterales bacterium]|nr:ABC transporter substrate-binding protein [Solirubrobacterales bacterium]
MRMNRYAFRSLGVVVLAMLTALLLAACGDDGDETSAEGGESETMTEVGIGTQPWIGYGPWWIAEEQGFDKDNGIDIKLVNFSTDQDLETGFASGKFQMANNATNTLIRLADLGIDYKMPLMEDFSLEADGILSCDPSISSIEDLEGAKVAFEEFSVSDVLFRYALDQAGISFDTIDYVSIPASDAGTAAVAGQVDVAVTYQPYLQAAVEEGDNCEVIYTAAERPGLISDGLAVETQFAEDNPDAVVAALRAWGDAVDYYNENTKEAQAIIAENVGSKPGELRETFEGVQLFDLPESQEFLLNEYEALWNDIKSIMDEQGQLEGDPQVSDYLDTSFGETALEETEGE